MRKRIPVARTPAGKLEVFHLVGSGPTTEAAGPRERDPGRTSQGARRSHGTPSTSRDSHWQSKWRRSAMDEHVEGFPRFTALLDEPRKTRAPQESPPAGPSCRLSLLRASETRAFSPSSKLHLTRG